MIQNCKRPLRWYDRSPWSVILPIAGTVLVLELWAYIGWKMGEVW